MRCAACGQENPDGFKFCGNCAAPLDAPAEPLREVRKTVTVVFCDLTGSTALGAVTDPETLRATMRGYYDEMRTILERHGGRVEKFIGDAVMAVFGVPVAYEDDALRAVRAAWEMRAAVPLLGLQARIGVNTGEVVAGERDSFVTGDSVNVAARLEQASAPGEVLIGAQTQQLVRDAVKVEPVTIDAKGKGVVDAYRLLDVDLEAAAIARLLDTPLVGRRAELEQLQQAFARAVREGRCHLFTLLGAAGVGKSRLVSEFLVRIDAAVVEGRCLDYGDGITFWPVVSILKQLGPRADDALARVVGGAPTPNELFWAVRALLESVAAERPLVVVFDDVQWGEETFLDLIDHIADLSRGAPLLLLCIARPELLDKRPGWGGGKLNATTILLQPLGREDCADLIAVHGGVEADLQERILAAADGNPLFVEEMVALAREVGDVSVPSTVQALLQARIEQLVGDERAVIERGAVEGEVFHRAAVLELTRAPDVEPQLMGLVRKELIHPTPSTLVGDQAFRFRHLLVRDAAYGALPKETRADLHERFATWLESHGLELIELDEIVGYHLEQAARYLAELGQPTTKLAQRAGLRLATAGRRAAGRSDIPGAINLLRRAAGLMPDESPDWLAAVIDRLTLLISADAVEERNAVMDELDQSADSVVRMYGRVMRLLSLVWLDPEGVVDEVASTTAEAIELFESLGDHRGLAAAWRLRAEVAWLQSCAADTLLAIDLSLQHAVKAGAVEDHGLSDVLRIGPLAHGPFTPADLRERIRALVGNERLVWILEGQIAKMEGRLDDQLAYCERIVEDARQLGLPLLVLPPQSIKAEILTELGRLDEALRLWEEVIADTRALGHTSFVSTMLIEMGVTHYANGNLDEAERLAIEGEAMGAAEDVINFAWGRGIRARVAADRGDLEQAEQLARSALDYAYRCDFPRSHADAHLALAHVLRTAQRFDDARAEVEAALAVWERYGWSYMAREARALLGEL